MNPYLTEAQRIILEKVRIGIAGAGGLGSNCAAHLVRSGIRRFVIADFDTVCESNLNRQFFFADQLGRLKTEALRENLLRINPGLDLTLFSGRITPENAPELFAECDMVAECFDNRDAKAMLIEALLPSGKPLICASGLAGFGHSNALKVRRIGRNCYMAGDMETSVSETCPPLSPRVGIAAAMEANTILALLLGGEI